jgi:hypothetical protein
MIVWVGLRVRERPATRFLLESARHGWTRTLDPETNGVASTRGHTNLKERIPAAAGSVREDKASSVRQDRAGSVRQDRAGSVRRRPGELSPARHRPHRRRASSPPLLTSTPRGGAGPAAPAWVAESALGAAGGPCGDAGGEQCLRCTDETATGKVRDSVVAGRRSSAHRLGPVVPAWRGWAVVVLATWWPGLPLCRT